MRKPRIKGDQHLALYRQQLSVHRGVVAEMYYSDCTFCSGWANTLLALADWTLTDLMVPAEPAAGQDG